ncbi:hypothetical protein H0H87_010481 [Tephrocybe sp. NHM501043]|nr:hypothetical protein H0H87_010481 [Tephrocybe sp. NHM501043]
MPTKTETNDITSSHTNERTFLVTLSARALGSLGVGVSILAIWIHWLVPSVNTATPSVVDKFPSNRHKRRSTFRAPIPSPLQQIAPSITINGQTSPTTLYASKHVYFEDSPPSQRNLPIADNQDSLALQRPPEESYRGSGSSSPTTPSISQGDEESIAESESSSRRSSLSLYLPKRICPFTKSRDQSEPSSPVMRTSSLQTEGRHGKRSGFIPPWSSRRKSVDADNNALPSHPQPTPLKSASFDSPSTDSFQSPTPTSSFFSFKPNRRVSSPVPRPRTQPYEAPYFALPPTSANTPTFDLRKSPPMLQEALINSARQNAPEDDRGRAAKNGRTIPKRRSASEGWNMERRTLKQQ